MSIKINVSGRLKGFSLSSVFFCFVIQIVEVEGATTYIIALLGQDLPSNGYNLEYQLIIANEELRQISVQINNIHGTVETLTVEANEIKIRTLEHEMAMNGSELSNKSLEVHSDDGNFVLQVFSKRNGYAEGLLAIPIQQLKGPNQVNKTVYEFVVATFCAVGGYCQIAIAAVENNTEVFVDIPEKVEEIALCNKSSYFRSHRDKGFTMNRFDALQLETTYDLTGTVIFSFKPIAVFVGSRNVTNGDIVAHTMEQLVPSSHWGKEFVVQTLGSNGYGDILKIVSHYTSTVVTMMSGFPSFNMTERYQTVTRRLSNGTRSHIQASHPIQVIQISGLTYATKDETSMLSMTVVPSVQNSWHSFKVACPDIYSTTQFQIVSEKRSCNKISASLSYQNDLLYCHQTKDRSRVKYTKYVIGNIRGNASGSVLNLENEASNISGILKCGQTILLPVGILYNKNVFGTIPVETSEYPGGVCKEGGKGTTAPNLPYHLDLQKYSEHALHLRVQVCGSATLRFMSLSTTIDALVSNEGIQIASCETSCQIHDKSATEDSFNKDAGISCTSDMSFFWFRQVNSMFCLGTGYHNEDECFQGSTQDNVIRIQTTDSITNVSLMGTVSEAIFNWDFIHVNGCKEYETEWRCTDRLVNCSKYEEGFCTRYADFAKYYCAKYCGICFADSYGRKFVLRLPFKRLQKCWILVTSLNENTNVGVTRKQRGIPHEASISSSRNVYGERYYDCSNFGNILNLKIISDDDVAVVVYYIFGGNNTEIGSSRIYPVDTFGTEFVLFSHNKTGQKCMFISEHVDVHVTAYFSGITPGTSNNSLKDSESISVDDYSKLKLQTNYEISGTSLEFNKPSMVFCYDSNTSPGSISRINFFLTVDTWSNEYVVPTVEIESNERQFKGILHIVSYTDNNIVTISGGFDAKHAIYNKGDKIEQEIDVAVPYRLTSVGNIAIGLYLQDREDSSKYSFSLLPSTENHHDTILTSVPANRYSDMDNTKTEFTTFSVDQSLVVKNETMLIGRDGHLELFKQKISIGESKYEMAMLHSGKKWLIVPGPIKAKYLSQYSPFAFESSGNSHPIKVKKGQSKVVCLVLELF
ncbi:uncharacterized protein LOC132738564 [Ruditapes philippinarum]|uniref:uncharacterized protein LOC132738564 n=1 Tax=Ruditapes philippinarum TaxID=129788 RepID=UPI00295B83C8|nr:uncharacterized protein LOC132738564 [Ruditapes philippinarum]